MKTDRNIRSFIYEERTMALFIAIYLLALFCYFHTRTGEKRLYRIINKYFLVAMYFSFAVFTFFRKYDFVSIRSLMMVALLFTCFGDVFLVFDMERGGDFFLAGNICFIVYEQMVLVKNDYGVAYFGWTFPVMAIFISLFIYICEKRKGLFKMGKMRWPMTWYLSSIILHGLIGLAMAILLRGTNDMLMGIGSFLFMISDLILTAYRFVLGENKWLIRANSLTYFTGILLIVLSMA